MSIEEMKTMKTQIMSCVQGQMGDLKNTDAKELGQAIDMIKDLSEAIYYCTITEAMEKGESNQNQRSNSTINYYTTTMPYIGDGNSYPPMNYRNVERNNGYMYYPNDGSSSSGGRGGSTSSGSNGGSNNGGGSTSYYTEVMPMPYETYRDPREGRSPVRRRMYMEGKEMHKDTNSQLKELETYVQELSSDVTEMIKDASPEEKATLRQKLTNLANKIA